MSHLTHAVTDSDIRAALTSSPMQAQGYDVEIASEEDLDEIVSVCAAALDWTDSEFDRQLFRWKHFDNPFGTSLILIARDRGGIAAVRSMMRWRFRYGDSIVEAARAVDTATHPRAQGRGLFTGLTLRALEELAETDVELVFNLPNEKSLAGYLKMGWVDAGPVPIAVTTRSPLSLVKLMRNRTAASKTSLPLADVGISVSEGLALVGEVDKSTPSSAGLRTDHSIDTLRWRYQDAPVDYRFLPGPDGSGLVVRLRLRGSSRELVVADVITSATNRTAMTNSRAGIAIRNAVRNARADYAVGWPRLGGAVTTTRFGPTLAIRQVGSRQDSRGYLSLNDFDLLPGDIELF